MIQTGKKISWSQVLVLWLTFKPDVPDFRNSKIADTIEILKHQGIELDAYDPYHEYLDEHVLQWFHLDRANILTTLSWRYDAIIVNSFHKSFSDISVEDYLKEDGVVFDIPRKLDENTFSYYRSL